MADYKAMYQAKLKTAEQVAEQMESGWVIGSDSAVSQPVGLIEAFAKADAESTALQANTGEFRVKNKFYVLTASRYQELSWGWESGDPETSYNYFTLWLTQGIGTSGHMLADVNKNGKTTLKELYNYISNVGDKYPFRASGQVYYQHVQVYPANSSYVLFCR